MNVPYPFGFYDSRKVAHMFADRMAYGRHIARCRHRFTTTVDGTDRACLDCATRDLPLTLESVGFRSAN